MKKLSKRVTSYSIQITHQFLCDELKNKNFSNYYLHEVQVGLKQGNFTFDYCFAIGCLWVRNITRLFMTFLTFLLPGTGTYHALNVQANDICRTCSVIVLSELNRKVFDKLNQSFSKYSPNFQILK